MGIFKQYLTETVGAGGLAYELKVHTAMKKANISGLNVGDKPGAGFSNQGAGDIEASYKGKAFNIEIKASPRDQMGGTSFRYTMDGQRFTPVKEMDPEDLDLFMAVAKEQAVHIDNYIKALRKIEPVEFHKTQSGVPIKASKDAREELKKNGLITKINRNIKTSTSFIIKHYNKKGVYYIQIGKAGLFYMGKNPLKLDVPELKGEIQVEFNLRYGGGKLSFPTDPPTPARSAGLRLQGRLITKGKSPYSLDNVEDIKKLFGVE
jgi:hypothetical protein|tara:strand:+ start:230 stop:1018 length:789 start_codon:yes stop_codon:yes gene_type:complete